MLGDEGYRIELEQFSGPLDLLLHLLREDELEVETIPVARVCDRYLAYLEDLDRIDIDAAGEFLVMASTLMRLKSRALLPGDDLELLEDEELDPRFELVRQLIQYRRFKRVADLLADRRERMARTYARGFRPETTDGPEQDEPPPLEGASVELLFATFARLLRETAPSRQYVVTKDDTPLEEHVARVETLVPVGERCRFRDLFPEGSNRAYRIGVFLAVLELMKRGRLWVEQQEGFDELELEGRPGWPAASEVEPEPEAEREDE